MLKPKKEIVLPASLLGYTAIMGVAIFPHFNRENRLLEYFCLIGGAVFLSFLLAYLFKKRKKD